MTTVLAWVSGDLNRLTAAGVAGFGTLLLLDVLVFGRPGRNRCNAPSRVDGRCRRSAPAGGRPCSAGHRQGWVTADLIGVVILACACVSLLTYQPLPDTLNDEGVLGTHSAAATPLVEVRR
ncbi:hypothetical protein [Luteipulveratus halotolerans]|uniref:hypothetical protein n=1 Tax=Luteipulveratus halotolerans TaxID=1631356 RepID=UPI0012FCAA8F|nr:hypothetical protein [Luteipulveratus halotolerans]